PLLALPSNAVARVDGWRSDFSADSQAQVGALLRPPVRPVLKTMFRLSGASTYTLRFRTTGDTVGVAAVVADRRGDFTSLLFGEHGAGAHAVTVGVPPEARRGRVIAIRLSFPTISSFVAAHKSAEGSQTVNDASVGTIRLARWPGTHR